MVTVKFNVQRCKMSTRFIASGQVLIFEGLEKTIELLVSPQQMAQFTQHAPSPAGSALEEALEDEEEDEDD